MTVSCKLCEVAFYKQPAQIKRAKNNFCSRSCAAKYNNKHSPKRKLQGECKICKVSISSARTYCESCWETHDQSGKDWSSITIGDVYATAKYQKGASIRHHARQTFFKSSKPKCCLICGYNKHIDVCHIQAVADFPKSTPISVVNSLDNLVGLCKNHHWELDHNLLTLPPELRVLTAGLGP